MITGSQAATTAQVWASLEICWKTNEQMKHEPHRSTQRNNPGSRLTGARVSTNGTPRISRIMLIAGWVKRMCMIDRASWVAPVSRDREYSRRSEVDMYCIHR